MVFNWGNNKPKQFSADLRLIGDRQSGKTTYIAALSRWPNAQPDTPILSVDAIGEAQKLVDQAQAILEQGSHFEGTVLPSITGDVPSYSLQINFKKPIGNQKLQSININCKDYSGEFFRDLLHQPGDQLEDYLQDCSQANGLLFLLDGTAFRKDSEYSRSVGKLLEALDHYNAVTKQIALILNKCEQPELWVSRHDPQKLARARFPEVYNRMQAWQSCGSGKVAYFVTSAFGVLGTHAPTPNYKLASNNGRKDMVLKDKRNWRPYGIISPIYWLCTSEFYREAI